MAASAGYGDPTKSVSTSVLDPYNQGRQRYQQSQQSGPYRGGLVSDFNFNYEPNSWYYDIPANQYRRRTNANNAGDIGYGSAAMGDADADVRGAANAAYELQNPNEGTSRADQQALLNMYKGRIAQKNSLAEKISGSDELLRSQEDLLKAQAGQALGEGVSNTRKNYNSRGLLYSGMREGGEQQVKQGVASQLSSGISGARREASSSKSAAQNAYAAVGLANAQDSMQLANQAFETASRNQIARLQAMQQLGSGIGGVAGAYYGSREKAPTTQPNEAA